MTALHFVECNSTLFNWEEMIYAVSRFSRNSQLFFYPWWTQRVQLWQNKKQNNSKAASDWGERDKKSVYCLKERGILKEIFPPIEDAQLPDLIHQCPSAYCGFDPTSDSLHVGNLLPMILLLRLQVKGVMPIAVIGDATAKIGDPSGRAAERNSIDRFTIEKNSEGIEKNLRSIFSNFKKYFYKFDVLPELKLLRNSEWYRNQRAASFVGNIERHFRISKMLHRESVRQRLNSSDGMRVTEFSYQIFQAYDWLQLFNRYKCWIQIGGHDQMGNIESGHDLIKRLLGANSYGFMTPLITTTSGEKLGKSIGNAIWLSPDKTSPNELYNFFMSTPDTDAITLVQLFTFCHDAELSELIQAQKVYPERLMCQRKLAKDVVTLVHGEEGLRSALGSKQ